MRTSPRIRIVSAVLTLLLVGCGASYQQVDAPLEQFTGHLEQSVARLMDRYDVPGVSVALIVDGETAWSAAFGLADVERSLPMTLDAVDHVGSISKSVTAWGVMRLVEDGEIDIDTPLVEYLSTWEFPGSDSRYQEITVRQLLNHTSGLWIGSIGVHYPPDGVVPNLRDNLTDQVRLTSAPGSRFSYSNVGYNLLELLIEEVTGESFVTYIDREVLVPLGMTGATFVWSRDIDARIPLGYDLDSTPVAPYVYPEKGSGGLLATVEDIARFVTAGMTNVATPGMGVLKPSTLMTMYQPSSDVGGIYRVVAPHYGFGHFVETLPTGDRAVWHGGQGHGWMTQFHSVPELGAGIVILTNSQRSWPLISDVLTDWAGWNGFSSVGMTNIGHGATLLWTLIGITTLAGGWALWRLSSSLVRGQRRFALRSTSRWVRRLVAGGSAVLLVVAGVSVWAQDVFYVAAVFPIAWDWIGVPLIVGVTALILTAVTTPTHQTHGSGLNPLQTRGAFQDA